MYERFTASARQVVVKAQDEAQELGHGHVGPEHELLGLLADSGSDGSKALNSLGVAADSARERVLKIVPRGAQRSVPPIPFNPGAKKVLELALREALSLGHRDITPGHVLLGLTHDREGTAMQVLVSLGADQARIRAAVEPLLPEPQEAGPQFPQASQPRPGIVTSDPIIRRLLGAAAGHALDKGRAEFGVSDLLAAVVDDEAAASAFADFGLDMDVIRAKIQRRGGPENAAD